MSETTAPSLPGDGAPARGLRVELVRLCRVPLQLELPPTVSQLEAFLAKPIRPLRGLLNPERLGHPEPLIYTYNSRPYRLASWTIQPQVRLKAEFIDRACRLEQVSCWMEGLGAWQSQLRLGLNATLRTAPTDSNHPQHWGKDASAQLEAEATAWGLLPISARPLAPVLRLALTQLLDRMERRCHGGLRQRAETWLRREQRRQGLR